MATEDGKLGTEAGTCRVIRSGEAYQGKQGLTYLRGLTGETVGKAICMTVLVLLDKTRAKTQLHRGVETAVYIVDGRFEMFFGPRLLDHVDFRALSDRSSKEPA